MGDSEGQERIEREGPGRRESDWQKPGFWLSVMGFLLTIAIVLLSAIWNRVSSIDTNMQNLAIASSGQGKDLESQRREFEEFKRNQHSSDDIRDTYISNARERIVKLEATQK